MQCSAVQCSAVQCSAVQCSAVQCSVVMSIKFVSVLYRPRLCIPRYKTDTNSNNNSNNNNNNLIFNVDTRRKWLPNLPSQGHVKALDDYWLRWIKLRLILRRKENRRTRRKTLEARERPTTTSYNPVRLGLTWNSVVKGNVLLNRIRHPCHPHFVIVHNLKKHLPSCFVISSNALLKFLLSSLENISTKMLYRWYGFKSLIVELVLFLMSSVTMALSFPLQDKQ